MERRRLGAMICAVFAILVGLDGLALAGPANPRTCDDLRDVARQTCAARYQCSKVKLQTAVWAKQLCQCLQAGDQNTSPIALGDASFEPLAFACCVGNAIIANPAVCKGAPARP